MTQNLSDEQLTKLANDLGLWTPTPMVLTHLRCMTYSLAEFLVTGPTICPAGMVLPAWTDQEAERAVPEFAMSQASMLAGLLGLKRTSREYVAERLLAAVSEGPLVRTVNVGTKSEATVRLVSAKRR